MGSPQHFFIWAWQTSAVSQLTSADQLLASPYWSPDGTLLLCMETDNQLAMFHDCSGLHLASQLLAVQPVSLAWAASGTVAVVCTDFLQLFTVQSGPLLVPTHSLEYTPYRGSHKLLSFAPDGMHLVMSADWQRPFGVAVVNTQGRLLGVMSLPARHYSGDDLQQRRPPNWCAWSSSGDCMGITYYADPMDLETCLHVLEVNCCRCHHQS